MPDTCFNQMHPEQNLQLLELTQHVIQYCACLQAANLNAYLEDIGIIFALDWLLDRCRSVPNVLGDCFTCAVVQHKCSGIAESARTRLGSQTSPLLNEGLLSNPHAGRHDA